jgi:hypothetical protein
MCETMKIDPAQPSGNAPRICLSGSKLPADPAMTTIGAIRNERAIAALDAW